MENVFVPTLVNERTEHTLLVFEKFTGSTELGLYGACVSRYYNRTSMEHLQFCQHQEPSA